MRTADRKNPGRKPAGRVNEELGMSILIVTGIEGARNCAAVVQAQLAWRSKWPTGARPALAALRPPRVFGRSGGRDHAECDPAAEAVWSAPASHPPADQLRPSGAVRLIREIPRRCTAASGADAGPPRRHRGHRNRAQIHGCRPAASLAIGSQRSDIPSPVAERLRMWPIWPAIFASS